MKKIIFCLLIICASAITTQAQVGNTLNYNSASSQYSTLPPGIVSTLTGDYTIEAWVYTNPTPSWQRVFDFGNGTSSYMFLTTNSGFANTPPSFAILTNGGTEQRLIAPSALSVYTWHHLAVVYTASNTTGKLFIDGVVVVTNTAMTYTAAALGNTTQDYVGRSQYAADPYYNGMIDELRISNLARYSNNFTPAFSNFTTDANTLALYHFDEGTGQTITDASGNGKNGFRGATVNAENSDPSWPAPGASLNFDGIDDYVNLGITVDTFRTKDFTVQTFFNSKSTAANGTIIGNQGTVCTYSNFWAIKMLNGTIAFEICGGNSATYAIIQTPLTYNDGNWHNVACTRVGTAMYIYIDRILVASGGTNGIINLTSTNNLLIGSGPCGAFAGNIEETRIWDHALTFCELRNYKIPAKATGLLANYHYDQGAAGAINAGITTLIDAANDVPFNGTLTNFALTGTVSNWVAEGVPDTSHISYISLGTGTNWSDPNTWVPKGVPCFGADVTIVNPVTVNIPVDVRSVNVGGGNGLTVVQPLNANDFTIGQNCNVYQYAKIQVPNGHMIVNGTLNLYPTSTYQYIVLNATFNLPSSTLKIWNNWLGGIIDCKGAYFGRYATLSLQYANNVNIYGPYTNLGNITVSNSTATIYLSSLLPNDFYDPYNYSQDATSNIELDGTTSNDDFRTYNVQGSLRMYNRLTINNLVLSGALDLHNTSTEITSYSGNEIHINGNVNFSGSSPFMTYYNLYEQTGGAVDMTHINPFLIKNATIYGGTFTPPSNLYVTGDLTHTGGITTVNNIMSVVGNFTHTGGTITGAGTIYFNGNGTYTSGGIAGSNINYSINNNATLQMAAANTVINGNSFTVSPSATLGITSPSGITAAGNASGNIQSTTRSFSKYANYLYNGNGGTQVTGSGVPDTVNNISINNVAGVTLSVPVTASNLTLSNGILTSTAANLLTIAGSSSGGGGSATSYVNGPIRKNGNTAYTFPIGKAGVYAPISISAPDHVDDAFQAEYKQESAAALGNIAAAVSSSLLNVSSCEYWRLDKVNDAGVPTTIDVKAVWGSSSNCGNNYITDYRSLTLAHFDEGNTNEWNSFGGTPTGSNTTGSITRTGVSSFSPFALGNTNFNPLPVRFSNIRAYQQQAGVQVAWTAYTEQQLVRYQIERSADAVTFVSIGTVAARNILTATDYTFLDTHPLPGTNYYRVRNIDIDGRSGLSNIVRINLDSKDKEIRLYPNPVVDGTLYLQSANLDRGTYTVQIMNTIGQKIYSGQLLLNGGAFSEAIKLPAGIPAAVYYIEVNKDGARVMNKIFTVQ